MGEKCIHVSVTWSHLYSRGEKIKKRVGEREMGWGKREKGWAKRDKDHEVEIKRCVSACFRDIPLFHYYFS